MTTDNRTNEPTPEQVEAAVHAAWAKSREFRGVGGQAEFAPPWEFQQVIRAALVAAQGAAPQAEAYDHCCNHPKCPGGSLCCCISEQRQRDCWNQWREEVAGDTKQAFRDAYSAGRNDPAPWAAAPVLPSSTVDEDALAKAWHEGFCRGEASGARDVPMNPDEWNPYRGKGGESRGWGN